MIKYVKPLPVASSKGLTAEVYGQIRRDFGSVVEPFLIHSSSPQLLAGYWAASRETTLAPGIVPRALKEAISSAVSKVNQCPYCVDAHTMMLMAAGSVQTARMISKDQPDRISDARMNSIVKWSLATRSPGSSILFNPPFTAQEAPEMIGTAFIYHYINRLVSVLLSETPLPSNSPLLKNSLKRIAAIFFSFSMKKSIRPGESLHLLPDVPLPDDLRWAKSNPMISRAFASFATVADTAGESILTEETRFVVRRYIDAWDGKDPGISRDWVEQAVTAVTGPSKSAARLALLTAIAPYQVDEGLIGDFRSIYKEDVQLLDVLAWSSFTAARKIGTWLYVPDHEG